MRTASNIREWISHFIATFNWACDDVSLLVIKINPEWLLEWNTYWLCFYQTRSAWSRDQESYKNHSPAYNFAPTVTKFCVMWEGLSFPHDTKFGNCRCQIVDSRVFPIWSLIHGSSWSGLIKAEPDVRALPLLYLLQRGVLLLSHCAHPSRNISIRIATAAIWWT